MAEQKTKPTAQSVDTFLDKIPSEQTRDDCRVIMKIMKKVTGAQPKMWGPSIVGFGKYHYKYASGHEGDSCLAAFSPRKTAITVYVMLPESERAALTSKLGKHKASKACIYIKKLEDINVQALEEIIRSSMTFVQNTYGTA